MPVLPSKVEFDDTRFFTMVLPKILRSQNPQNGTCRFCIEGTDRSWWVDLQEQVVRSASEISADATITLHHTVLGQLVRGELDGASAVLSGAMRIEGDSEVVLRVGRTLQG